MHLINLIVDNMYIKYVVPIHIFVENEARGKIYLKRRGLNPPPFRPAYTRVLLGNLPIFLAALDERCFLLNTCMKRRFKIKIRLI